MNIREELYISGAGLTVAHVYQAKTGRRVAVLDPVRKKRAAVMALIDAGLTPRQVARSLDIPLRTVCAIGIAALRARKGVGLFPRNPTFSVAKVGLQPYP